MTGYGDPVPGTIRVRMPFHLILSADGLGKLPCPVWHCAAALLVEQLPDGTPVATSFPDGSDGYHAVCRVRPGLRGRPEGRRSQED